MTPPAPLAFAALTEIVEPGWMLPELLPPQPAIPAASSINTASVHISKRSRVSRRHPIRTIPTSNNPAVTGTTPSPSARVGVSDAYATPNGPRVIAEFDATVALTLKVSEAPAATLRGGLKVKVFDPPIAPESWPLCPPAVTLNVENRFGRLREIVTELMVSAAPVLLVAVNVVLTCSPAFALIFRNDALNSVDGVLGVGVAVGVALDEGVGLGVEVMTENPTEALTQHIECLPRSSHSMSVSPTRPA